MKDYTQIDKFLNILEQDVYNQPSDSGHNDMLQDTMGTWSKGFFNNIHTVLDVGCGSECIAKPYFEKLSIAYYGIDLDQSIQLPDFKNMDMSFLEFPDNSFDAIFARHVLEHSPMVLLTLLEWHRVASKSLFLVLPNPKHYGYIGRNHYHVMPKQQARWLLRRSGWKIVDNQTTDEEFRFACEKLPILGSEGWASEPLDEKIYKADRDDKSFKEYDDELRRYL